MNTTNKETLSETTPTIKRLEDEIDRPLKRSIALLNLLGFKTKWCCCGFDYQGQPSHKSHTYDSLQIFIEDNEDTKKFFILFLDSMHQNDGWSVQLFRLAGQNTCWALTTPFGAANIGAPADWNKHTSEHYHEVPNIKIKALEDFLVQLGECMEDETTLEDSNAAMTKVYRDWNVAPSEPWVIKKTDWL